MVLIDNNLEVVILNHYLKLSLSTLLVNHLELDTHAFNVGVYGCEVFRILVQRVSVTVWLLFNWFEAPLMSNFKLKFNADL